MELYLLPIIFLLIVVEPLVSGRWARFYFEHGLPLFSKTLLINVNDLEASVIVERMNKEFRSSGLGSSIYFRELDGRTIAFREKIFELTLLTYTPIMHGRISMNREGQNIQIVGLANWFPLVFCLFWYSSLLYSFTFEKDVIFLVAPLLIFGVIYIVQRKKYLKLYDHLSEINEKKSNQ